MKKRKSNRRGRRTSAARKIARHLERRRGALVASCIAVVLTVIGLAVVPSCGTIDSVRRDVFSDGTTRSITNEPDIRVRVQREASELSLSGPPGLNKLLVRAAGGSRQSEILEGPLKVTSSPTGVKIAMPDPSKPPREFGPGVDVEFLAAPEPGRVVEGGSVRIGDTNYPGVVTIRPRWTDPEAGPSQFDVIVTMPIETYLPGVVAKEMFAGWPRAAYEVQAVAARSYAISERERARRNARTFDVENTTADQVYGGLVASPPVSEAVRSTRGMLLFDGNEVLRAYYSSTCGGRPGSAAAVWPTTNGLEFNRAAPIQGRAREHWCQPASRYRWETTRSIEDFSTRIRQWGVNVVHQVRFLANVRQVQMVEANPAGRPSKYKLIADNGREFTLTAEELRVAANTTVRGLAPITRENQIFSSDLELEVFNNQVRIRGRGFGHGVGMCQWCAKGMGDNGIGWRSQMQIFYPGAAIKKQW